MTNRLDVWENTEGIVRDALLRMLAKHRQPARLTDNEQSVTAKITGGPAPWDDPVAHLLADISAGTRTMERGLDIACGFTPRQRGGSDGNTRQGPQPHPDLVDTLNERHRNGSHRELTAEARITIGAWHRSSLLLLGAEGRWTRVRDRDEEDQPIVAVATCPYCESPVRIQPDLADDGDRAR